MTETLERALTAAELDLLVACEATVSRGFDTFREVGEALLSIRENRLYRAEFATFDEYASAKWGLSGRRINQLISGAQVGTIVPEIQNEAQARALAPMLEDPDEMRAVYEEAADRSEGKPTAAAIADVVRTRKSYAPPVPEPVEPDGVEPLEDEEEPALPGMPEPQETAERECTEDFQRALDRLVPDPEAPKRRWRIAFLDALGPTSRLMAQFKPEHVADNADDECLDELARLEQRIVSYCAEVRAARPIPDNVRHLRVVS